MEALLRWLNGWVYTLFGADGLVVFSAHPLLYSLGALALLLAAASATAWWLSRRVRALTDSLRLALALALTPEGRRCLALARQIRRGGSRLRHALREGIEDRTERRTLLRTLERFTRSELRLVLEHAVLLIARADDRREGRLRAELERLTQAWGAASGDSQRERLQQAVADARQRLARAAEACAARDRHVQGLEEAAGAVQALEEELRALRLARTQTLPEFRDRLAAAAGQLSDLRRAYGELDAPR